MFAAGARKQYDRAIANAPGGRSNGLSAVALTKLDVLSIFERIGIATNYRVNAGFAGVPAGADPALDVVLEFVEGESDGIDYVCRIGDLPTAARHYVNQSHTRRNAPKSPAEERVTLFAHANVLNGGLFNGIESIRREVRVLRVYAVVCTLLAGAFLTGVMREARTGSFATVTVHRINVVDREGRLAMVLTDHDDFPAPIVNGKSVKRMSGNNENGIVFYNQMGNEQGALMWDGVHSSKTTSAATVLSYDSATTDQLLQLDDFNDNGKESAFLIGWNQPDETTPQFTRYLAQLQSVKSRAQRFAIMRAHPEYRALRRFFFGYGFSEDNVSRLTLNDSRGNARIDMFVTPSGQAKLQFLDAEGKVVYELPK